MKDPELIKKETAYHVCYMKSIFLKDLGPVVQSIVSLTTSLRCQLISICRLHSVAIGEFPNQFTTN